MGQNREPKPTHIYMQTHYNAALALQMRREVNFRWSVDLNVKSKLLENNIKEYFYILRVRKDFSKHMKQGKRENKNSY